MITFWGQVALATLAVYTGLAWLISKLPSPKRTNQVQTEQDRDLHGSNRDRAVNSTHGWR